MHSSSNNALNQKVKEPDISNQDEDKDAPSNYLGNEIIYKPLTLEQALKLEIPIVDPSCLDEETGRILRNFLKRREKNYFYMGSYQFNLKFYKEQFFLMYDISWCTCKPDRERSPRAAPSYCDNGRVPLHQSKTARSRSHPHQPVTQ